MNAVDYTWHVLAVIQIRGSRVENLEEKPMSAVSYTGLVWSLKMSDTIASLIPRLLCMGGGIESGNETSIIDILYSRCTK